MLLTSLVRLMLLGATAVGILAIIIFLAVTVLLALFFGILYTISELFASFTIMT